MSRVSFSFAVLNAKLLNFSKPLQSCATNFQFHRHNSNVQKDSDVTLTLDSEEDDFFEKEAIIESKRNKSELNPNHRNILYNEVPYNKPITSFHTSVKYNRRMFGRYGQISGVNPGIAWPTKQNLINLKEYESVAHPFTIQEMVQNAENVIRKEKEEIEERQKKLAQEVLKLDKWKLDIKTKTEKNIAIATAAKEKKERLIEEVRRHFGYKIDPKDDRFKELLAQKEKAEKKKAKEARTKAREEKLLLKVLEQTKDLQDKS